MMMIRILNVSGSDGTIAGMPIPNGEAALFPADRCAWTFNYNAAANEYQITDARFYDGVATGGVDLVVTGFSGHLGYIGKSGRFVPITR